MENGMTKYVNGGTLPARQIIEDANEHCPGQEAESTRKINACEGCPNQQICAIAHKGPDPGLYKILFLNIFTMQFHGEG
ncbi:hypothetical protein SUGI_0594300 [Cryptomeria japonica]|nr:hypothetical protein SUGI_0594300 [Cryptomeria japonica]